MLEIAGRVTDEREATLREVEVQLTPGVDLLALVPTMAPNFYERSSRRPQQKEAFASDAEKMMRVLAKQRGFTVSFSKDNWLFGIRAIDAQGHRGVSAFPLPQR